MSDWFRIMRSCKTDNASRPVDFFGVDGWERIAGVRVADDPRLDAALPLTLRDLTQNEDAT